MGNQKSWLVPFQLYVKNVIRKLQAWRTCWSTTRKWNIKAAFFLILEWKQYEESIIENERGRAPSPLELGVRHKRHRPPDRSTRPRIARDQEQCPRPAPRRESALSRGGCRASYLLGHPLHAFKPNRASNLLTTFIVHLQCTFYI